MKVTFVGTGDAFGSGGRFNTCFHVVTDTATVLVDCGASSLVAMNAMGIDPNGVSAVILSHLHGDHFGGLPFLLLRCQFVSRREAPLIIAGPPGLESRVNQLAEAMFPGSSTIRRTFAVEFIEIQPGVATEICGITVQSTVVIHPSGAPATGLRLTSGDKILAYSGDSEWTDALLDVARDADLFVCECYTRDIVVPYHINYRTLETKRPLITARRMMLTHMSEDMLAQCRDLDVETAEDGRVITL